MKCVNCCSARPRGKYGYYYTYGRPICREISWPLGVYPPDYDLQLARRHSFKSKQLKKPKTCEVCRHFIWTQGSVCKVCKYVCHFQCESQVVTACNPPSSSIELQSHDTLKRQQQQQHPHHQQQHVHYSQPVASTAGVEPKSHYTMSNRRRGEQFDMDLTYITERIIAMTFTSESNEATYRNNVREGTRMLKTKHGENYMIINLSDKRRDLSKENNQVLDYGWPDTLAPPLERLCSICKSIDSWLSSDLRNVVVLHCKGGENRTAVVVAAYMHYSNICASADQALDRYAMKKFCDDKTLHPSQQRYVEYFAGLLSGAIKINSSPLYLHHMVIHGIPNFDSRGGCRAFVKVYQGMTPIFTSGTYAASDSMHRLCMSFDQAIPLRGDILIKCYHKQPGDSRRETIFRVQFHTCAISDYGLVYSKGELDDANHNIKFPDSGQVEFIFSPGPERIRANAVLFTETRAPVDETGNPIVRWDSYENFNNKMQDGNLADHDENARPASIRVSHVFHEVGPVDGSLYAQVQKKGMTNGTPAPVQNGPHHLSMDSGFHSNPGHNYSNNMVVAQHTNQQYTQQSHQTTTNNNNNIDEQKQLDDILSELLGESALLPSAPQVTTTRDGNNWTTSERSVSQSEDGRSKSIMETSKTFSNPDPYTRSETTTVKKMSYTTYDPSVEHAVVEDHRGRSSSYTYRPISPQQSSMVESRVRSPSPVRSPTPTKTFESQTYRTYDTRSTSSSEEPMSWLQQQQAKLKARREGRDLLDLERRTVQEKQLVAELKNAQNRYQVRRRQSESDEQAVIESYRKAEKRENVFQNGPVSPQPVSPKSEPWVYRPPERYRPPSAPPEPYRRQMSPESTYKAEKSVFVQSTNPVSYTVTITPGKQKPPPIGTIATKPPRPTSPSIPARTSSRNVMSMRHWQSHGKPLRRQASDTSHDRERPMKWSSQGTQTPPSTPPRTASPAPPAGYSTAQHHYTYTTNIYQQKEDKKEEVVEEPVAPAKVEPKSEEPPPLSKEQAEAIKKRLDELEKRLTDSASPPPEQPVQDFNTWQTSRTFEYKPKKEVRPKSDLEEDMISLRPIGPGLQPVEPDRPPSRPSTPAGFVASPVGATPPFPVSPQTPYQNTVGGVYTRSPSYQFRYNTITTPPHNTGHVPVIPVTPPVTHMVHRGRQRHVSDPLYATIPDDVFSYPVSPVPPQQTFTKKEVRKVQHQYQFQNGMPPGGPPMGGPVPPMLKGPDDVDHISLNQINMAEVGSSNHSPTSVSQIHQLAPPSPSPAPFPTGTQQRYQYEYHTNNRSQGGQSPQPVSPFPMGQTTMQRQEYHTANRSFSSGGGVSPQPFPTGQNTMQRQEYQSAFANSPQPVVTFPPSAQNTIQRHEFHSSQQGFNQQPQQQPPSPAPGSFPTINRQGDIQLQVHHQQQMSPVQQQQQQQFQQQQQQQFHTERRQQYHTENRSFHQGGQENGMNTMPPGGLLQVDTRQQHMSSTMPRSASAMSGSQFSGHESGMNTMSSAHSQIQGGSQFSAHESGMNTMNSHSSQMHGGGTMRSGMSTSQSGYNMSPPIGQSSPNTPSVYTGFSRRGSLSSNASENVFDTMHHTPKFVRDTSKFWYKPHISREDAINLLKDKPPGTFVVRDSNSFPGAFGLAVKVAQLPPNVQAKTGDASELVRHFLIEPTPKGVRLKGCSNEPVFGSLAALVYQHSITPLALPVKLALPTEHVLGQDQVDVGPESPMSEAAPSSASALLAQGAACNVLFINTVDTESLTGPQAVSKAVKMTFSMEPPPKSTVVHFKVNNQGITLTDNHRKLFFRRHYPVGSVTFCGMDPEDRRWSATQEKTGAPMNARIFGFVARKQGSTTENSCHLFAEIDPDQPATAIANFVTKVMLGQTRR
ncbi:tensin-1 isoform X4 [Lingula anatina]|uniref:Tensin-1 isoform X4 n=1 Tax=Lingula anatina TaxID=7574 RepID=A0A1S3JWH7_LINAN|nr:tensin-1 isoform X4 [Lingula anatina]|eukprot:XP_013414657.1 tensin-1 isoform X4 [Lingula anatina]